MRKSIKSIIGFTSLSVLLFSILFFTPARTVQAQDFSLDRTSAEVPAPWSPADGIFWFGLAFPPVFSSIGVGLVPADNIDAFSYGLDHFTVQDANAFVEFRFSVDRPTVAMPASVVKAEVTGNGAAGDKFAFTVNGLGVITAPVSLASDAPRHSLTPLPAFESEIDGLSFSVVAIPDIIFQFPVYYSIDPATVPGASAAWGFAASPADIYFVPPPIGAAAGPVIPAAYATTAALGLMAGDDIDAVTIEDAGMLGVFDAGDQILFSLAPGSPTLAAMGASAADILFVIPGAAPVVFLPAASLRLLMTDNLDALAAMDPENPPEQCEADGDANGDGSFGIIDITFLIDYLAGTGPAPNPLYRVDVNSDCVIDTLDIIALTDAFGGLIPLPVPTCCEVTVEFISCCKGTTGNVDGDPNDIVDIGDLTHLIAHLYLDNRAIDCLEEANINGDTLGELNLADLALLIDFLFISFTPLPTCDASVPSIGIDMGIADSVRLIVADTQAVGNDLVFGVELWFFNDSQDVIGAAAGFNWNSPNMRIDSTVETVLKQSSFGVIGLLPFDNAAQEFQFSDIRLAGQGLVQSGAAKHMATYWMTYSNWTPGDAILFDTARVGNVGYGFVGGDNLMWFPEFVSQGIIAAVDTLTFTGNGAAIVDTASGVVTVSNIGPSGDDGVAIQVPTGEQFVGMEIGNIDLSVPDITLTLEVNGEFSSPVGLARGNLPPQLVGAIGIATPGGAIQISADFSSLGDPNVQFEVYNGPLLTGGASIPGGGVIAIGSNAGFGMPIVTSLTYSGVSPPSFTINLDRVTRFTLTNGTILIGDKIRLIGVNATGSVDLVSTINVNASGIGFFTLTGVTTSSTGFCCLGFTGNINCDPSDLIDIADLTELIDHLFINFPPLCCPKEGNIDGDVNGTVDIADLTALIDFLFINFTATSPCQ